MHLSAIISKALLLPIAAAGVIPPPSPQNNSEISEIPEGTAAVLTKRGPLPKSVILPGNPSWCKYKHSMFDNWVAVYSRDWGHDDHMNGFLDNLKGDCWLEIDDWGCSTHGEHGAYATFSLPWLLVSDWKTKRCVASAFHKASPPHNRQSIECCAMGDTDCANRDAKRYFDSLGDQAHPSGDTLAIRPRQQASGPRGHEMQFKQHG